MVPRGFSRRYRSVFDSQGFLELPTATVHHARKRQYHRDVDECPLDYLHKATYSLEYGTRIESTVMKVSSHLFAGHVSALR